MYTRITLRHLEHIVELSRRKSLREAAAALHITESALGSSIDQIERQLGHAVCIRKRAVGVTMTPAGRALAVKAESILEMMTELEEEFRTSGNTLSGTVRIGLSPALVAELALDITRAVRERYPDLAIELETGFRHELFDRLDAGTIDLAVMFAVTGPMLTPFAPVRALSIRAGAPLDTSRDGRPMTLTALAAEPFIYVDTALGRDVAHRAFTQLGIEPRVARRTKDLEMAMALVGAGMGTSLFPVTRSVEAVAEGRIRLVELEPAVGPVQTVVAWSAKRELTRRAGAARDLIVEIG